MIFASDACAAMKCMFKEVRLENTKKLGALKKMFRALPAAVKLTFCPDRFRLNIPDLNSSIFKGLPL